MTPKKEYFRIPRKMVDEFDQHFQLLRRTNPQKCCFSRAMASFLEKNGIQSEGERRKYFQSFGKIFSDRRNGIYNSSIIIENTISALVSEKPDPKNKSEVIILSPYDEAVAMEMAERIRTGDYIPDDEGDVIVAYDKEK